MHPLVPIVPMYRPPLVVSYLGTNGTGLSIGAADANRYIIAIGVGENDSAGQMTDCQFDGVSGTIIYNPSVSDSFGMAYKNVPTGTSVTVSIGQFGLVRTEFFMVRNAYGGYYGVNTNSSGGTTLNCSNATPVGNVALIMGARSRDQNSSFAAAASGGASGVTLSNSGNHGGGGNPSWWAASGITDKLGSASGITCSGASAFSSGLGAMAVFY